MGLQYPEKLLENEIGRKILRSCNEILIHPIVSNVAKLKEILQEFTDIKSVLGYEEIIALYSKANSANNSKTKKPNLNSEKNPSKDKLQSCCEDVAKQKFKSFTPFDDLHYPDIDASAKEENNATLLLAVHHVSLSLLNILKTKHISEQLHMACLGCLRVFLCKIRLSVATGFMFILTGLFLSLADRNNPSDLRDVSEEVKLSTLKAVKSLLYSTTSAVLQAMLSPAANMQPKLGHAIFFCLKIVRQETNKELRILALEILSLLGFRGRSIEFPATTQSEKQKHKMENL